MEIYRVVIYLSRSSQWPKIPSNSAQDITATTSLSLIVEISLHLKQSVRSRCLWGWVNSLDTTAVCCDTCAWSATVSTWGCLSHTQQLLHCFNTAIKCGHQQRLQGPHTTPGTAERVCQSEGKKQALQNVLSTKHSVLFSYTVLVLIIQASNNFPVTEVGRRSKYKENVSAEVQCDKNK